MRPAATWAYLPLSPSAIPRVQVYRRHSGFLICALPIDRGKAWWEFHCQIWKNAAVCSYPRDMLGVMLQHAPWPLRSVPPRCALHGYPLHFSLRAALNLQAMPAFRLFGSIPPRRELQAQDCPIGWSGNPLSLRWSFQTLRKPLAGFLPVRRRALVDISHASAGDDFVDVRASDPYGARDGLIIRSDRARPSAHGRGSGSST